MKKSYIISTSIWLIICVLASILYQYFLIKTTGSGNYNWATSITVWVGGAILGLIGSVLFLLIDFFTLKDITKKKSILLVLRIILIITIVILLAFLNKKYF